MSQKISDLTKNRKIDHTKKIIVEETRNQQSLVTIKPEGFSSKLAGTLFFALFWNGFIAFWTTMALTASVFFAAFSIPFWLVGIGLILGIINSVFGSQEILIRDNDLVIRKRTFYSKGETIIPYKNLISIEKKSHLAMKNRTRNSLKLVKSSSFDSGFTSETPVITFNKGDLFIGEHLSDSDKEWLVDYLNEKIVPKMKFISFDSRTTPESHPSYTPQSRDLS